jgi:hypothetical protein
MKQLLNGLEAAWLCFVHIVRPELEPLWPHVKRAAQLSCRRVLSKRPSPQLLATTQLDPWPRPGEPRVLVIHIPANRAATDTATRATTHQRANQPLVF